MNPPTLLLGDCIEQMQFWLPDNSVDAIVTDPPYGLSFMGKKWDYDVPQAAVWAECLRVLKPGGYLLAFAGTRTQHRMCVNIEDAGFEIRDMIAWIYGSGFPKSLDVSKAIDKATGAERSFTPVGNAIARMIPGADQNATGSWIKDNGREFQPGVSEPATEAARQWQGWGTALKPALEPITVARKPLGEKTVADNVLRWGTGGLNIDGCRVESEKATGWGGGGSALYEGGLSRDGGDARSVTGRWPANLIHDGSDEVVSFFPDAKGQLADVSTAAPSDKTNNVYGKMRRESEPSANSDNDGAVGFKIEPGARRLDSGSAARFFYAAKASKADRNDGCESLTEKRAGSLNMRTDAHSQKNGMDTGTRANHHPTVKPTDLMRYLCRLVTQPGGVVLDPFMGSGSTGKAARLDGFDFIGIERDPDYMRIAEARVK